VLPYAVLGVFAILAIFIMIRVKPTHVRLTASALDLFSLSIDADSPEPDLIEADASEPEELEPVLGVIPPEPDDIVE
jgi:hypothetical protein